VAEEFIEAGQKFAQLVEVMAKLRAPGGCPWDRKQTFDTIKSYLLEEAYEVMDAIDRRDWPSLEEELGDLLLQPIFFAEMAREQGLFSIADSIDAINEKLVRRHPHVFGNAHAETPEDVKVRWDEIKKQEKGSVPDSSVLDVVPRNLPALMEAEKIGHKAAATGFEWPDIEGVLDKLQWRYRRLSPHSRREYFGFIQCSNNNSPSITRIRGSSHVISELSIAGRQGTNGEGKADSQSLYSSSKMQRHYLARPKTKLQFERTLIIYFVNYRRTYVCNK